MRREIIERSLAIAEILARCGRHSPGKTITDIQMELEETLGDIVCILTVRNYVWDIADVGTRAGTWKIIKMRQAGELEIRHKLVRYMDPVREANPDLQVLIREGVELEEPVAGRSEHCEGCRCPEGENVA